MKLEQCYIDFPNHGIELDKTSDRQTISQLPNNNRIKHDNDDSLTYN